MIQHLDLEICQAPANTADLIVSYRNAQWYQQTGQYPLRCDKIGALFGQVMELGITVPFYSEDNAQGVRRRSVIAQVKAARFNLLSMCKGVME